MSDPAQLALILAETTAMETASREHATANVDPRVDRGCVVLVDVVGLIVSQIRGALVLGMNEHAGKRLATLCARFDEHH